MRIRSISVILISGLLLTACGDGAFGGKSRQAYPVTAPGGSGSTTTTATKNQETIFGDGGIGNIFGDDEERPTGSGIGVNSFLWRASLDTLSFMPLASADPFGGVIITDWHSPVDSPDERFKATVYILDRRLRADGIRVSVFKQVRDQTGQWTTAPMAQGTSLQMENAILTRARQLRVTEFG